MGRNGMGKTTLLKSVLGLVRRAHGAVRIAGRDMTRAAPHAIARRGIAYVPGGARHLPQPVGARESGDGRARRRATAGATGPSSACCRPSRGWPSGSAHGGAQLSGGEQQMLTIGRALMTNPDLLILDEATEGLAPLIAREIWGIVRPDQASRASPR